MTANFIAEYVSPTGEVSETKIKADDVALADELARQRMPEGACKMTLYSLTRVSSGVRPVALRPEPRGYAA